MILIKNRTSAFVSTILLFTMGLFFVQSCKERTQIVYEGVEIEPIRLQRLDRELFALHPANLDSGLTVLKNKYGQFYHYFAVDMLAMKYEGDSLFRRQMRSLLDFKPLRELERKVDSMYTDVSDLEEGLTSAMRIYHAQFPKRPIPQFITFISEFTVANVTFESQIGIGLDMYMNSVFANEYHYFEFPEFRIRKLQREYIVPNAIMALGSSRYEDQQGKDLRFLAHMLYEGKIRYFMKALLPELHDSLIMGYTSKQLQWVKDNEAEMWSHYGEKELLYKDEPSVYLRYLNDGPFTSADGVPQDSAPGIGVWTGWKIIQSYMRNNPEVTLEQLMDEIDFDKILKKSKYKPGA